jgi:hypothetical protein
MQRVEEASKGCFGRAQLPQYFDVGHRPPQKHFRQLGVVMRSEPDRAVQFTKALADLRDAVTSSNELIGCEQDTAPGH